MATNSAQIPLLNSPARLINPYLSIVILTIATFMEMVDTTVVNVALPRIASDLSSTPMEASWIIGSYLIANAMILPISGWLAIYFGRKNYFQICVILFTLSSFFCGISSSIEMLIFFRIVQGLSGSGLATSEQAMIADLFPPEKLGRAFSIYAFGMVFGVIIGPTLGGWITDNFSWHWIFFINIPIGILSYFLVKFFVFESERSQMSRFELLKTGRTIDWIGIILVVVGFGAFQLVMEEGNKEGWLQSNFILLMIGIAFAAILVGLTWEYYQDNPAVDISMLANRNFALSATLVFIVRFVTFGTTFLIPFLAQTLLGYSATNAGLLLVYGSLVLLVMMPIVGYLTDMFDARVVIVFGLIITCFSFFNLTSISLDVGFNDLALSRVFQIFGLSFLSSTMMAVGFYYVPPNKNDSASALINLASNVGASLGVALSTTLIYRYTQFYVTQLSTHTTNFNPNYTEVLQNLTQSLQNQGLTTFQATAKAQGVMWDTILQQATMNAVLDVFRLFMFLILLAVPIVFLLKAKKKNHQVH